MKNLSVILISLVFTFLVNNSALALSLGEAKQQGLVGERSNGYLGAVKANKQSTSLVQEINSKRKQKYQEIAKRNGTSLNSVEKLAGKKSINRTAVGHFINTGSGWQKK